MPRRPILVCSQLLSGEEIPVAGKTGWTHLESGTTLRNGEPLGDARMLLKDFRYTLPVEDQRVEQGSAHMYLAVMVDVAQSAELIHEKTHSGARPADHLDEHFLTKFHEARLRLTTVLQMG